MKRIFLMSSERSGSNLLRILFDRSNQIAAPPAPQLIKGFASHNNIFFKLDNKSERKRALELALKLIENHPIAWNPMIESSDLQTFIEKGCPSFWSFFDLIYSAYAKAVNKSGYFVKENNVFNFANEIIQVFPESYFLYLVRDPRDVIASFSKVPGGPKSAIVGGYVWRVDQQRCLNFFNNIYSNNIMLIRYEDLIDSPEDIIKGCYEFVDIEYSEKVLYSNMKPVKTQGPYWHNLSKEIIKDNKKKYRNQVRNKDIKIIESICKHEMLNFNYCLESEGNSEISYYFFYLYSILEIPKKVFMFFFFLKRREKFIRIKRALIYLKINRFFSSIKRMS